MLMLYPDETLVVDCVGELSKPKTPPTKPALMLFGLEFSCLKKSLPKDLTASFLTTASPGSSINGNISPPP